MLVNSVESHKFSTLTRSHKMKLEMRAWDLDVKLELEDNDSLDQLQVLDTVKNLLETLAQYEKVDITIKQLDTEDILQGSPIEDDEHDVMA